jgi:uncharacterized membrane protein
MDHLLLLKFIHVAGAVVWIGGGFGLVLAGSIASARASTDRLLSILALVGLLAPRLFVPASLVVLVSGILLATLGGYGWPAWLVLGLAGIAATVALGAGFIGPACERALKRGEMAGPAAARGDVLRAFRLARFDYVLHGAIVFLMVVKPGWNDLAPLAVVAAAISTGAVLTLAMPAARAT